MKVLLFTTLLILTSLEAKSSWVLEDAFPSGSSEAGVKLVFQSDDRLSGIETTFLHLQSGYHLILNLKWAPLEDRPTLPIKIETTAGLKEVVDAKLLKGGHRIVIPSSKAEEIAKSLLKGDSVTLSIHSYKATLHPTNLNTVWSKFMKMKSSSGFLNLQLF